MFKVVKQVTIRLGYLSMAVALIAPAASVAESYAGMPDGSGSYQEYVEVYDEFLQWLDSEKLRADRPVVDVAGKTAVVHPDYSAGAMAERRTGIEGFHARLQTLAVRDWPRAQQAEFLRAAVIRDPANGPAHCHLARVAFKLESFEEAERAAESALSLLGAKPV